MIHIVKKNLRNIPGLRINRKIVVIESDDWGGERIPNKSTLNKLIKSGYKMDSSLMNMVDSLESNTDLEMLFETLYSHQDNKGNYAILSAFFNMANPDYKKIKESNFSKYHYLTIDETAKKYSDHDRISTLYHEGIKNKLFHADYHGREHIQVNSWLKKLQEGHKDILYAFDLELNTLPNSLSRDIQTFRVAYAINDKKDMDFIVESVADGLNLFESFFKYRSNYFVAPNGIYPRDGQFEDTLKQGGIDFLGGANLQKIYFENKGYKKRHFYLGKRNNNNQTYITRNVLFEPYAYGSNAVNTALKDIEIAFRWRKPAIITSHRANYVGSISENNRNAGLKNLNLLLSDILKKWPDVEFMSSKELTSLIGEKQKLYNHG